MVGSPATVTANGGTPQSAVVTTAFGTALSALVTDANSNPVSGVTVTFTAPDRAPAGLFPLRPYGYYPDEYCRRGDRAGVYRQ